MAGKEIIKVSTLMVVLIATFILWLFVQSILSYDIKRRELHLRDRNQCTQIYIDDRPSDNCKKYKERISGPPVFDKM